MIQVVGLILMYKRWCLKKLYDARIYLKLVKRTWLEDESIDPKDIYEDLDEIKIKPSKAYRYGFNLQAGIDRRELN